MGFRNLYIDVKKNKIPYYVVNILRQAVPVSLYQKALNRKLKSIKKHDEAAVIDRVNYYNKLQTISPINDDAFAIKELKVFNSPKAYNFDLFEYWRYFSHHLKLNFLLGDITHVETKPTIQKSRPVGDDNQNAILLKLDKKRHFLFVKDTKIFAAKKNLLIGRGVMSQPHRIRFMEMYFDNPLCDLGQVNKRGGNPDWIKPKINIIDHLDYKFILSLEGNDVATNLKWIMSSNSIAVMPKPKYETWFMEGRLMADYHYIQIKDDFSDLEAKLHYYIANPDKALVIIKNANAHVWQFMNKSQEDLISLLVLQKFFYYTGQTQSISTQL
ncbi:glycosyl transferase family 90 [Mucilaginibacter flavus]|uniref:glycosyl transferase family 90 n=1 Tax=Mucilaginibacter flavus TaxID=931504 RepID=UPI0025B302AD|nr:glycosyl transferase family 90 [Mucilaginibacter flavus]MDN3580261.1 glycosyl transferase family 90 [Mucilaginibacter flavus]